MHLRKTNIQSICYANTVSLYYHKHKCPNESLANLIDVNEGLSAVLQNDQSKYDKHDWRFCMLVHTQFGLRMSNRTFLHLTDQVN